MNKSNLSLSSSFNYDIDIENQLNLIADIGFKWFSFGLNLEHFDYLNKGSRNRILPLLNDLDISIDTIHGESLYQDEELNLLKSTIDAVKTFKCNTIVLHISPFQFKKKEVENYYKIIEKKINSIVNIAETEKINIALENVFPYHETDLLLEFSTQLNSEYIGFCYDSSHDQIDGPRDLELLDKMIDCLKAVHLSDRIKPFVDHVIPGEGFIDFEKIAEKLSKSTFKGPYLFEVMMTHSKYKEPKEFLMKLKEEGDKFLDRLARLTQQRISLKSK